MARFSLLALSALVAIPLAAAWYVSEQVMRPRRRVEDNDLTNMPLPVEDVRFASRDGTVLSGWFIPAGREPAPAIVLSHGWARSRCELLPHAQFLHRAGFAILMFDYRHRGDSEGDAITMGIRERDDLLAAIDTLAARPEVDASRIGLFGMSMGGVISIVVTAQDSRVKALAVEGPFASHETILTRSLRHYSKLPLLTSIRPLVRWTLERRFGGKLADAEPIRFVNDVSPRPLYIMGDENDAVVGLEDSRLLFDAAAEPKRYWLIPDSDHARGWQFAGEEYERRLLDFYVTALSAERPIAAWGSVT